MVAALFLPCIAGSSGCVLLREALRALDMEVYDAALARVGEVSPDAVEIDQAVSGEFEEVVLSWRVSIAAPPSPSDLQDFQARVEADRNYVQGKFFPQRQRRVRHAAWPWRNPLPDALRASVADVASNDTGLPAASASRAARALETWCKRASWNLCALCGSVQPQHLKESATRSLPPALIDKCKNCTREGAGAWVPWPEEVPTPLRSLSRDIVLALRPLTVDCGPEWQADYGYYFHSAMLRLSWSDRDVEEKISELSPSQRGKATEVGFREQPEVVSLISCLRALEDFSLCCQAFEFLMASNASEYSAFVRRHRRFLQQYPDADANRRKRPLQYIEEAAVECALWPHLYWDARLCETTARLADVRRQKRRQGLSGEDAASDSDMDEDVHGGRHSLKRNFMAKVLGPIADYAGDYELLQFVFDLSVWSDVGGKKGALRHIPMWQAMKGAPWTPQYWKVRHAAALDMQAQCGFPVAFLTWAPFEWSAPYHEWLLRQMSQLGRQRLQLAGPEALHLAHLLTELFREWVCGGSRKFGHASTAWRSAVFGGTNQGDGRRPKVNFVGRLEFQDGKRKEATQDYHGRAAVHLHGLIFAESLSGMDLVDKVSASVPPEGDPLRGYVLDGQTGRTGSGWPQHDGPNEYDPDQDILRLHHTALDKHLGVRGYIPEVLDVLKCHQDLQVGPGSGLMLKYTATYLPKFSDGPGKELMDDASSAYAAARRVLFTYHPGEPEMWLHLANQNFPLFFMGGTLRPIIAPHPGMPNKPDYVRQYEAAEWRGEMNLLDFLRRVNSKGAILEHIRKAHRQSHEGLSVEAFALRFEPFGEKIIAAEMVSMLNDKYYGQWLALNVPFRTLEDLLVPDILEAVPDQVKFLACALHRAPEMWRNERWIRDHMALRAHRAAFVETVVHMIAAQDYFIQQHLTGHLQRAAALPAPRRLADLFDDHGDDLTFTAEQMRLEENINKRVDQALRVRWEEDDAEYERLLGLVEEHASMVAGSGAPGTGKTAVLDRCIRRAQRQGARVLIALPTGVQRARMRQRHPDADLDTCHGAFLFHKPLAEAMGIMTAYDLIVIDEAPQLFEEHFERLEEMWLAAGRIPCLVFAGDEWQLPPPDHSKRSLVRHPKWRLVHRIELHRVWRQSDGDPLLDKLAVLRKTRPTGVEGTAFVRDLCRNHKAWSGHHWPTAGDIADLLDTTQGGTTVITCTRRGAAWVNALCQEVLFAQAGCPSLGQIPADYESNPDNYDEATGQLKPRCPEPLPLTLYSGLRVRLTRNMDKARDFVNGMSATVLSFDASRQAVIVETETSEVLCVYLVTDDQVPAGRVTAYPLRPGYADTVHKFQGAELSHVTFWPDRPGCAAAGYVALSRVRRDCDYLLGGCVTAEHFVPAM